MEQQYRTYLQTPLGLLKISGTETFIASVAFVSDEDRRLSNVPPILTECKSQLQEYFSGTRKNFDVPVRPEGTEFQKKIWSELMKIPFGESTSYSAIAKQINNPEAARAVGLANGKNQIAIIIPCHRVVGSGGQLTGYAAGIWRKRWLLEMEKNVSGNSLTLF